MGIFPSDPHTEPAKKSATNPVLLASGLARTGTGGDLANQVVRYSRIQSKFAKFGYGRETIHIDEHELVETSYIAEHIDEIPDLNQNLYVETVPVRFQIPQVASEERVAVFLNGFALVADEEASEAKKVLDLELKVIPGSERWGTDWVEADVSVRLQVDCDTPECNGCSFAPFESVVDRTLVSYDIVLGLVAVTGRTGAVRVIDQDVDTTAGWDGPNDADCYYDSAYPTCLELTELCGAPELNKNQYDELEIVPNDVTITAGQACLPEFNAGFLALRGFSIQMQGEHHMLALGVGGAPVSSAAFNPLVTANHGFVVGGEGSVGPSYASTDGGTLHFLDRTYFKNWRKHQTDSGFLGAGVSYGTEGSFSMTTSYAMVALPSATIVDGVAAMNGIDGQGTDNEVTVELASSLP